MTGESKLGRRWALTGLVAMGAGTAGLGLAWLRWGDANALPKGAEQAFWNLSLKNMDGSQAVMSRYLGRPLLVNFWATWCPPCVEELPLLEAFYRKNRSKSWQVLGIAVDRQDAVERFLAQMPLTFPMVMAGPSGIALTQSLGNQQGGLPFSVLFGADRRVLRHRIGKLSESDLANWAKLAAKTSD